MMQPDLFDARYAPPKAMGGQTLAILQILQRGDTITPMEALRDVGCFRLAARIKDLRDAGYTIATETETDGEKHWARYRLA